MKISTTTYIAVKHEDNPQFVPVNVWVRQPLSNVKTKLTSRKLRDLRAMGIMI